MAQYGIYRECDTLELIAFTTADSYEEAVEKARQAGYGKNYRVQEFDDE